jgi:hypothetical protein
MAPLAACGTLSALPCLTVDHKTLILVQVLPEAGKKEGHRETRKNPIRQTLLAFSFSI